MPTPDEDRRADAILALGEYTDRRGRRWTETEPHGMWFDWEAIMRIDHSRMRLLIVRDLHREIGCSPRDCKFHPVPVVAKVWGDGWFASRPGRRNEEIYPTLAEAFAAAERLATTARGGEVTVENRIISRDDQRILQLLIDGAWFDYAIVEGAKPPRGVIRYGRPWQEHVPAHSRHLLNEQP